MKTKSFFCLLSLMLVLSLTMQAQDEPHRNGPRRFEPTLSGTWQKCMLQAGQDGQPQLTLLPVLKFVGADNDFQQIDIHSDGRCFVQKQGNIEKLSDSTFIEKLFRFKPDSVNTEPVVMHYRFKGPMWLVVDYNEAGEQATTSELWIRVRSQDHLARQPRMRGDRPGGKKNFKRQNGSGGNASKGDSYDPFATEKSDDEPDF